MSLLVRREPRGRVYVLDQLPGRSAKYRDLEQVAKGAIALSCHVIYIVAVAREGHSQEIGLRRRHDLDITCGVDLTIPEALPAEVVDIRMGESRSCDSLRLETAQAILVLNHL